jgi:hypothetical protein
MSAHATIKVFDSKQEFFFYRHMNGDPEGLKPILSEFIKKLRSGVYRDNAQQTAPWLILLGYIELHEDELPTPQWKAGTIDITSKIHDDSDYYYEIDLTTKLCRGWHWINNKLHSEVELKLN